MAASCRKSSHCLFGSVFILKQTWIINSTRENKEDFLQKKKSAGKMVLYTVRPFLSHRWKEKIYLCDLSGCQCLAEE